jgi:hypothetical protein
MDETSIALSRRRARRSIACSQTSATSQRRNASSPAIPAQSLAVSSLDDDSIIGEQFARPLGPDAGPIVSKTDTTSHEEAVPCVI